MAALLVVVRLIFAFFALALTVTFVARLFLDGALESLPFYATLLPVLTLLASVADWLYPLVAVPWSWVQPWLNPELGQVFPTMPAATPFETVTQLLAAIPGLGQTEPVQQLAGYPYKNIFTGIWDWGLLIVMIILNGLEGAIYRLAGRH